MYLPARALFLLVGASSLANASKVDAWGRIVYTECEWWGMPEGCDKDRPMEDGTHPPYHYSLPEHLPTSVLPSETGSANTTTTSTATSTSGVAQSSLLLDVSSMSTTILDKSTATESASVNATITSRTSISTTSGFITSSGTSSSSKLIIVPSTYGLESSSILSGLGTLTTEPTTTPALTPEPTPEPAPAPAPEPAEGLTYCDGSREGDHCTGRCHTTTERGKYDDKIECVETNGQVAFTFCDRAWKFFRRDDNGDCNESWGSTPVIRPDGTNVYNTPGTRRILVHGGP